jgi:ribosomal protein S18 acetylase RimI-like enzyme
MDLRFRKLHSEEDYWRSRRFIRQVFLKNQRRELSWHIARFDYWWARRAEFLPDTRMGELVFLWETPDEQIAAVLHPEHTGVVFMQVDPDLRTRDLEEQMVEVAEEHLMAIKEDGSRKLYLSADQHDQLRHEILSEHGFVKFEHPKAQERQRRRSLESPIAEVTLADGYTIRAMHPDEIPARGLAAWRTTRTDEPENELHGWKWLLKVYQAPLYRRDLDIVAVTPDGEIGSFCTLWYDDFTRSGYFEPVGTAMAHQRKGLAKAVMTEALRRIQRMGADMAFVSSYTPPAHALYESMGFNEFDLCEPWIKVP